MATASVTVPSTGLTADSAQHGNLGRAADYAGDCYCNPLTDPYALRDCYYALSRLLLPPVASRWPLDFWHPPPSPSTTNFMTLPCESGVSWGVLSQGRIAA